MTCRGMRGVRLNTMEGKVLNVLAQVQFATAEQLAVSCAVSPDTIWNAVRVLQSAGLVEPGADTRPRLWGLTRAGAARQGVSVPSGGRHSSWAVMQSAVHRNAVEIELRDRHPGFRFLGRLELYRKGFNPSPGEYGGTDGAGATWLVLIDDYLMESRRLLHHWTRIHRPPRRYWPEVGRAWRQVAHHFVVFATSPDRCARHEAFARAAGLPADIRYLEPIWPRACA